MALAVTTNALAQGAVDQALHVVEVTFNGSWTGLVFDPDANEEGRFDFQWGVNALTTEGPQGTLDGVYGFPRSAESGSYQLILGHAYANFITTSKLACDKLTCKVRAKGYIRDKDTGGTRSVKYGTTTTFQSYAVDATADDPTISNITSVSADLACDYFPNTDESDATVTLQYKRSVDPAWIDAGASDVVSGYAELSIARSIAGLAAATQYDVRLKIVRTTANSTTAYSDTVNFTTSAAAPTITTGVATNLTGVSATLNGIVNPNGIATTYYFDYGLTVAYGTSTAVQGPDAGIVPVAFNAVAAPLLPNHVYHFRAHAVQAGVDYYGADATFSTDTQGHIMPSVYQCFAKYGVQTDFYFCVEEPSATGSDRFLNAAVPWIAGDAKVDKDGAGLNNVSNLPTRIGATQLYKWTATAAELQANKVNMLLIDADGPAWRDLHLAIETRLLLGQLDIDATQIGGNVSAMSLVGVGTGYGLFAKGSSGIRAEAQGTSGHGVIGVGIGAGMGLQAQGAVLGANVTNLFDQLEGPEPTTAPADNQSVMKNVQYLKRRHTNKVTQDSNWQTWYRDNSVAVMTRRQVSDDLITQTQLKLV